MTNTITALNICHYHDCSWWSSLRAAIQRLHISKLKTASIIKMKRILRSRNSFKCFLATIIQNSTFSRTECRSCREFACHFCLHLLVIIFTPLYFKRKGKICEAKQIVLLLTTGHCVSPTGICGKHNDHLTGL